MVSNSDRGPKPRAEADAQLPCPCAQLRAGAARHVLAWHGLKAGAGLLSLTALGKKPHLSGESWGPAQPLVCYSWFSRCRCGPEPGPEVGRLEPPALPAPPAHLCPASSRSASR